MWFMLDNEICFETERDFKIIAEKSKHCVSELPKCYIVSAMFSDPILSKLTYHFRNVGTDEIAFLDDKCLETLETIKLVLL